MSYFNEDYRQSCRLCLSSHGIKIPIFEDSRNTLDAVLATKILTCVSIKVEKEDPYPSWICQHCQIKIDDIYEFRRLCSISDAKLKQYYNGYESEREHLQPEFIKTYKEEVMEDYVENEELNSDVRIKQEPPDYCNYEIESQPPMKPELDEIKREVVDINQEQTAESVFSPTTQVQESQVWNVGDCASSPTTQGQESDVWNNKDSTLINMESELSPETGNHRNDLAFYSLVKEGKRRLRPRKFCGVTLECPTCTCPFTYQAAFEKHLQICKDKLSKKRIRKFNGFACETCNILCETLEILIEHQDEVHGVKQNIKMIAKYKCSLCNSLFQKRGQLGAHRLFVHGDEINRRNVEGFRCNVCKITFKLKGELICHQGQFHRAQVNKNIAQPELISCDMCGMYFIHKWDYGRHKETCCHRSTNSSSLYRPILPKEYSPGISLLQK